MTDDKATWGLLLPFDTDDEQFNRGFECGRVWDMLDLIDPEENDLPTDPVTVHAVNAEMMIRMAEARQLRAVSTPLDDTWIEVVFEALDA